MTEREMISSALGDINAQDEFLFAGKDGTHKDQQATIKVFGKLRRWRFDWAFPEHRIAWEVDGGSWIGGRHSYGTGFEKDIEKMNHAMLLGWTVIRSTTAKKSKEAALEVIKGVLEDR